MLRSSVVNITLKIGLSISMLYTALAGVLVPQKVTLRWPNFIANNLHQGLLGGITALACVCLAIWLFIGRDKFLSSISTVVLVSLTCIVNLNDGPFVFSLSPLFFMSLALAIRYYPRVRIIAETHVTPLIEDHMSDTIAMARRSRPHNDPGDGDVEELMEE